MRGVARAACDAEFAGAGVARRATRPRPRTKTRAWKPRSGGRGPNATARERAGRGAPRGPASARRGGAPRRSRPRRSARPPCPPPCLPAPARGPRSSVPGIPCPNRRVRRSQVRLSNRRGCRARCSAVADATPMPRATDARDRTRSGLASMRGLGLTDEATRRASSNGRGGMSPNPTRLFCWFFGERGASGADREVLPGSRTSYRALRQEFRESGDFTGRRLARIQVFSIRLIPDWKARAVGAFLFFSCLPTDRRRDASRTRAKSRRRVSASAIFSEGKAPRGNEQTRGGASSKSERDRARTQACHDAAHLRVRGPRAHRAGGAHQPQRELRHGRRGGASRPSFRLVE